MQGISYKYIHVDSENELDSHKTLLALADHSAYSAMFIAAWKNFFYAMVTAPMQTKHSLQEKFGSEKNAFAAVTGLSG